MNKIYEYHNTDITMCGSDGIPQSFTTLSVQLGAYFYKLRTCQLRRGEGEGKQRKWLGGVRKRHFFNSTKSEIFGLWH